MFNRFNGNVEPFASDATGTNRTVFGDVTQSDDIDDNLNADFKKGWEIVGVNDNPTKQDFNALAFTISNLLSYLYQQGVAEWNTAQEYFVNSYCVGSDGKIYRAKTGTSGTPNQGNDPTTDSTNWENLDSKFVDLLNAQTIAGIKTFSSFPITPSSAPTTNYQVANKKYVDDNAGISLSTANSYDLGVGQTWQDVTASRSAGVTYTNSTGKPIMFVLITNASSTSITVDSKLVGRLNHGSSADDTVSAIVPNGSTYSYTNGTAIDYIMELR